MKLLPALLALCGLGLAVWLVAVNDATVILAAFTSTGWGLAAIILVRLATIGLCGWAWALLLRGLSALKLRVFFFLRFIREAVNVLLPVASVGGDILGARLVTYWGMPAGIAGASVIMDLLIQAGTQAAFTALGVVLLAQVAGSEEVVTYIMAGLGVAMAGLLGFFLVTRLGGVHLIERLVALMLARLTRRDTAEETLGIDAGVKAIWANPSAPARAFGMHLLAWLAGVLEIWIALAAMGHPVNLATAAIIESLGQAVRSAAFPVPAGLGVQEGGFVLLGHLLGIGAGTALALSLVKRVPDVVLGFPGLLSWYWLEQNRSKTVATIV